MVLRQQDEFPHVPLTTDLGGDWEDGVFYPSDDGLPMGENDAHVQAIIRTSTKLRRWARHRNMFVAADMFYYWERGNPRATVAPDIFVVRDLVRVPPRTSYRLWNELVAPSVTFEFLSTESQRRDLVDKLRLYERIAIPEYFMFDPLGRLMSPPLQGYRLAGSRYVRLLPDAEGWILSEQLGIKLKADGEELLLLDAATGAIILHPDDIADSALAETAAERALREAAEARSEAAEARSEAAEARSEAAEARNARLLARLAELGIDPDLQ